MIPEFSPFYNNSGMIIMYYAYSFCDEEAKTQVFLVIKSQNQNPNWVGLPGSLAQVSFYTILSLHWEKLKKTHTCVYGNLLKIFLKLSFTEWNLDYLPCFVRTPKLMIKKNTEACMYMMIL